MYRVKVLFWLATATDICGCPEMWHNEDRKVFYDELKEIGKNFVRKFEDGLLGDDAKSVALKWIFPWMCDEKYKDNAWTEIFDNIKWGKYAEEVPNEEEKDRAYSLHDIHELITPYEDLKNTLKKYPELSNLLPECNFENYFPLVPTYILETFAKGCYEIWLHVRNNEIPNDIGEQCNLTLMSQDHEDILNMVEKMIKDCDLQLLVISLVEVAIDLEALFLNYRILYSLPTLFEHLDDKPLNVPMDYLRNVADILYTGNDSIPRCYQLAAKLYAYDTDRQLSYDRLKHCREVIAI